MTILNQMHFSIKNVNIFFEALNFQALLKPQVKKEMRLETEPWIKSGILKAIKKKILCLNKATRKTTSIIITIFHPSL